MHIQAINPPEIRNALISQFPGLADADQAAADSATAELDKAIIAVSQVVSLATSTWICPSQPIPGFDFETGPAFEADAIEMHAMR